MEPIDREQGGLEGPKLKRVLGLSHPTPRLIGSSAGVWELTATGVGGTIGGERFTLLWVQIPHAAGIFVVTGFVARDRTGAAPRVALRLF